MSGMQEHPLAPSWHRVARLLFEHGESFYNFRGLRSFKAKFDPVWEPRYLAATGGVASLLTLTDVAAMIGGGVRGVFAK
jgi:phosphatidylglycerol lysyltransferase